MFELSHYKRQKVEKELKDFAFEQSPLFQRDITQGMEVAQHYEVTDDWRSAFPDNGDEERLPTHLVEEDTTSFELAFNASRIKYENEKPDYTFAARFVIRRFIQPNQLVLSQDDWEDLGSFYSDSDEEEVETQGQVIQMLVEAMSTCEQYRRIDYSYDTREGTIRVDDETGFLIDDTPFNTIESHPYISEDYETNGDDLLLVKDSGDELLAALQFEEATSSLREEYEENGDIMPHEDKIKELRFLINCLKKRTIAL